MLVTINLLFTNSCNNKYSITMKKEDNNYMYKNIKIIIIQSAKRLLNVTIVCFISLNIYVFAEDKLQIQSTCIAGKFQVTETLSYKLKCTYFYFKRGYLY